MIKAKKTYDCSTLSFGNPLLPVFAMSTRVGTGSFASDAVTRYGTDPVTRFHYQLFFQGDHVNKCSIEIHIA